MLIVVCIHRKLTNSDAYPLFHQHNSCRLSLTTPENISFQSRDTLVSITTLRLLSHLQSKPTEERTDHLVLKKEIISSSRQSTAIRSLDSMETLVIIWIPLELIWTHVQIRASGPVLGHTDAKVDVHGMMVFTQR